MIRRILVVLLALVGLAAADAAAARPQLSGFPGILNANVTPTSGTNASLQVPQTGHVPISSALSSALATKPAGNAVTISAPAGNPFFVTQADRFSVGDNLLGPAAADGSHSGWSGTPGTGFAAWLEDGISKSGVPPPDDACRTTGATDYTGACAIPRAMLVPLTATGQRFSGDLPFCVDAHALVADTDADPAEGIVKVRFYVEGNYIDVTNRTVFYYTDPRGGQWALEGYCVTLRASLFMAVVPNRPGNTDGATGNRGNGHWGAEIFVRGFSKDGTFATQLLGTAQPGGATSTWTTAQKRAWLPVYPDVTDYHLRLNVTPSAGADTCANDPATGVVYATATDPTYVACTFRTIDDAVLFSLGYYTVNGLNTATLLQNNLPTLIKATETHFWDPYSAGTNAKGIPGYVTVDGCTTGVTVTVGRAAWTNHANTRAVSISGASTSPVSSRPGVTIAGIDDSIWRPMLSGAWNFRCLTFDHTNLTGGNVGNKIGGINYPANPDLGWEQAVRHTVSGTGDNYLLLGVDNDKGGAGPIGEFVTEATMTYGSFQGANVVVNSVVNAAYDDFLSQAHASQGVILKKYDNNPFTATYNGIRIVYSGSNSTALLQANGSGQSQTFSLMDGGVAVVGPSATVNVLGSISALYDYLVAAAPANFSFTLLATRGDHITDRNPIYMSGTGNLGASCSPSPACHTGTTTSVMLPHADWFQWQTGGISMFGNAINRDNIVLDVVASNLTGFREDMPGYEVANLSDALRFTGGTLGGFVWGKGFDHVVYEHVAVGDGLHLLNQASTNEWFPSARSEFRASIAPYMDWGGSTGTVCPGGPCWVPTANPIFKDDYWVTTVPVNGTVTPTAGHTGTQTVIGDQVGALGHTFDSLFASAATGDFTPAGDLLDQAHWVKARTKYDVYRNRRPAIGPKGPAAPRITSATFSDLQMPGVAAATVLATPGATGTVTLQWHTGAGETGPLTTTVLDVTVNGLWFLVLPARRRRRQAANDNAERKRAA